LVHMLLFLIPTIIGMLPQGGDAAPGFFAPPPPPPIVASPPAGYDPGYAYNDVAEDTQLDPRMTTPKAPAEKFQRGRTYHGHWYPEGHGACWTHRSGRWAWNERRCPE
jgi:hypothetical protein